MATGSCLCGTVKYSMDDDINSLSHCHCSMCRKSHGTPFASYAHASNLRFTEGEDSIVSYQSSPGFMRAFCGDCGSVLPEASAASDGTWYVPAGAIDGDPGARPEEHIFVESKASWYEITDDLPQRTAYGDEDSSRVIEQASRSSGEAGVVAGSCLCGDVTFRYTNPKLMMYCHCSRCRKVKGAAHGSNVFVAAEDFVWLNGQDKVVVFDLPEADRFGNSFCNTCGSSLPRQAAGAPVYNIPAGSLDDEPGIESKGHIFVGSKSDWFEITDGRDQYEKMPDS